MSEKRRVFEDFAADYDRWFDDHADVYRAQMRMLRRAVPSHGFGFEVGVGSGRFAVPLGISCGIDPSLPLARMARNRGVEVSLGCGEHLPYRSGAFDHILMMTVICFLDDVGAVFREVCRVLAPSGILVLGCIERDGAIFNHYHAEPEKGRFLRHARFYSTEEIVRELQAAGFSVIEIIAREQGFSVLMGKNHPVMEYERGTGPLVPLTEWIPPRF